MTEYPNIQRWILVFNSFGNVLYSKTTSEEFFPLPQVQTMSLLSVVHRNTTNTDHIISKIRSGDNKNINFFEIRNEENEMVLLVVICSERNSFFNQTICNCIKTLFHEFIELQMGKLEHSDVHDDFSSFVRKLSVIDESIFHILSPSANPRLTLMLPKVSSLLWFRKLRTKMKKLLKRELECWNIQTAAIYVDGDLLVCSEEWKTKSKRSTLELFISFQKPCTARDIPLFLEQEKGRLVSVKISRRVEIMYFLGSKPFVEDIIQNLRLDAKKWNFVKSEIPSRRLLRLEKSIRAVLFVQKNDYFFFDVFLVDSNSASEEDESLEKKEKKDEFKLLMCKFYKDVSLGVFSENGSGIQEEFVPECYIKQKKFNFYALANKMNQEFYLVMDDQAPKFAVRPIAVETFKIFQKLAKFVKT